MIKRNKSNFVIGLLVLLIICINVFTYSSINSSKFTTDKWNRMNIYSREELLESLFEQYNLIGMDRKTITDLLGTNGTTDIFSGNVIAYYVGKEYDDASLYIGPLFLVITFDLDNEVIYYRTVVVNE